VDVCCFDWDGDILIGWLHMLSVTILFDVVGGLGGDESGR
jgi:hypothetical protein